MVSPRATLITKRHPLEEDLRGRGILQTDELMLNGTNSKKMINMESRGKRTLFFNDSLPSTIFRRVPLIQIV